ncbi:MAG: hypothetical protein KatS3mg110_2642 [Pirellulaceae bacterium]|nr:MAG: hypothetical protein KatS3mg110_2642 [Pirellulaceae bacterium]
MLKRIVWPVVGGTLVLLFLFGRDTYSYVKTSLGWVKDGVKERVPIGFELERARRMIRDLEPEIRHNMTLVAREEVGIRQLEEELQRGEAELARAKDEILKLKADLETGSDSYIYAGRTYSRGQVETELQRRFQRYKTKDEALRHLRQVVEARRTTLEAARDKLEAMMAAKSQLELDVEALEARLKMVEVASARGNLKFDDNHLSRTKELLANIKARIDVAAKLVNADEYYHEGIPLSHDSDGDVLEEITQYFEQGGERVATAR